MELELLVQELTKERDEREARLQLVNQAIDTLEQLSIHSVKPQHRAAKKTVKQIGKKLHWTQRPENRRKLFRVIRGMQAAKQAA